MCGITGLFLKSEGLRPELGRLTALMLAEMRDRGPDSAGFAVYGAAGDGRKITCVGARTEAEWHGLADALSARMEVAVRAEVLGDHCLFRHAGDGAEARALILELAPDVTVLSEGRAIEIFKGLGDPGEVTERYRLEARAGTHAIAHTRMATESAVTIAGSHPFSTGADTCLAHNGSLSNHNRLRARLARAGERFQTQNDSEVAAGFLAERMRRGESLAEAVAAALKDLDGFYTFAIGTAEGFAVVRDPIACKPAVIAETGDWVAMASEYRAIAPLPGASEAEIWEPEPARIYSWSHAA